MSINGESFFKKKREWSEIKDDLLKCYIYPYFVKILKTGNPVLYVDCFAGKGKFDDEKDGSPLIALEERKRAIATSYSANSTIKMAFIEPKFSPELQKNIENSKMITSRDFKVYSGKYQDVIRKLLSGGKDWNVFLYIDPFGIKNLNLDILDFLKTCNFASLEILINFNSFGFFRQACKIRNVMLHKEDDFLDDEMADYSQYSQSQRDDLTRIIGSNEWENIVEEYQKSKIDGFEAEIRIGELYANQLKKHFKYVLNMPIRSKLKNRPKYRMIHLSQHEQGCLLMAQNMMKRTDCLYIMQQRGEVSLFSHNSGYEFSQEGGFLPNLAELRKLVIKEVTNINIACSYTEFMAKFFTDNGLISDLNSVHKLLEEIEAEGIIKIERNPSLTTTGRPTKFWSEKKGQTIVIRRCIR